MRRNCWPTTCACSPTVRRRRFPAWESDAARTVRARRDLWRTTAHAQTTAGVARIARLACAGRPAPVGPRDRDEHAQPDAAGTRAADVCRTARGDSPRATPSTAKSCASGWSRNHYHATTAVQLPGEFAARGGIVDLFAADWDQPVRLELFGDQIESIRRFDLASQRSVAALDEIEITVLRPDRGPRGVVHRLPAARYLVLARGPGPDAGRSRTLLLATGITGRIRVSAAT